MSKLTVSDLKKAIADLPDDMLVMVSGYESGVESPSNIRVESVYYVGKSEYCGDHEIRENTDLHIPKSKTFSVFYLGD